MFAKRNEVPGQPWKQHFVSDKAEDGKTYWWGYYNQSTGQVRRTRGRLPLLLTEQMVITRREEGSAGFRDVTSQDLYHALRHADQA